MTSQATAGARRGARFAWSLALTLALLSGCSDSTSRTFILQPGAGEFSLTGRVRVLATNTGDTADDSLGVFTLDDLSGVRVRLRKPDGTTDSVLTRDGVFEFRYDEPGLYRASCVLFPAETLAVIQTTLTTGNATFPETLVVRPSGVMRTYPNPFPHWDPATSIGGLAMECDVPSLQTVPIRILDLAGEPVRADSIPNYPAGFFHYHWISDNDARVPVPLGMYWAAVRLNGVHHVDLVVME